MAEPAVRIGRREQKKRATQLLIRDVALRLFVTRGYEQTTVDQIARAAHVSRQTFFNYYPEKSALLELLIAESHERTDDLAVEVLQKQQSTRARLAILFGVSVERMEREPELARIMVVHRSGSLEGAWRTRQRMSQVTRAIRAILAVGVSQGEVREDIPLRFLAELAAGAFTAVVLAWSEREGYPLHERALQAADYIAEAVRPRAPARSRRRQAKSSRGA